jgi:hypothetical protein
MPTRMCKRFHADFDTLRKLGLRDLRGPGPGLVNGRFEKPYVKQLVGRVMGIDPELALKSLG